MMMFCLLQPVALHRKSTTPLAYPLTHATPLNTPPYNPLTILPTIHPPIHPTTIEQVRSTLHGHDNSSFFLSFCLDPPQILPKSSTGGSKEDQGRIKTEQEEEEEESRPLYKGKLRFSPYWN